MWQALNLGLYFVWRWHKSPNQSFQVIAWNRNYLLKPKEKEERNRKLVMVTSLEPWSQFIWRWHKSPNQSFQVIVWNRNYLLKPKDFHILQFIERLSQSTARQPNLIKDDWNLEEKIISITNIIEEKKMWQVSNLYHSFFFKVTQKFKSMFLK